MAGALRGCAGMPALSSSRVGDGGAVPLAPPLQGDRRIGWVGRVGA